VSAAWLLRSTRRRLGRSKRGFVALVLAFALIAGLGASALSLGRATTATAASLAEGVEVVAYLSPRLSAGRAEALAVTLRRLPGVRAVRAVDPTAALAHLRRELAAMGSAPAVVARMEEGFLPGSLEIALEPGPGLPVRAADLVARLRRLEGVQAVDAMADGVGQVAAWMTLGRRLANVLAALAAFIGVALVLGSVLRERHRRREEAAALALVGATPLAIGLPAGLLGALGAGLGAVLGLAAGTRATALIFGRGAGIAMPAGLAPGELLAAALGLVLVGLVSGWLSMPRPRLGELR
jgi:cell division protein FtsX